MVSTKVVDLFPVVFCFCLLFPAVFFFFQVQKNATFEDLNSWEAVKRNAAVSNATE
jgi:hypothetical protein